MVDSTSGRSWAMRMCGQEVENPMEWRQGKPLNAKRFWYYRDMSFTERECGRIDWEVVGRWKESTLESLRAEQGYPACAMALSNELFMKCLMICGTGKQEWDEFHPVLVPHRRDPRRI